MNTHTMTTRSKSNDDLMNKSSDVLKEQIRPPTDTKLPYTTAFVVLGLIFLAKNFIKICDYFTELEFYYVGVPTQESFNRAVYIYCISNIFIVSFIIRNCWIKEDLAEDLDEDLAEDLAEDLDLEDEDLAEEDGVDEDLDEDLDEEDGADFNEEEITRLINQQYGTNFSRVTYKQIINQ
jgi:hypothetical protein